MTITFFRHGPPISSAYEYLTRTTHTCPPAPDESDLLKAIRVALRGSDTDSLSTIHSTSFSYDSEPWEEDQLTWNAHTVVLSRGGVMQKKWNFEEEGQSIQWACIGWLEHCPAVDSPSSPTAAHYTAGSSSDCQNPSERPTFGPFAQVQQNAKLAFEKSTRTPGVFIFLRSTGRIFLHNGLEFTFALPFIVRKAWPLSPHGVMIQRVLESSELTEAELTREAVLPTIFSATSPFSEAGTVGLTTGILGGISDQPASLKDEDENLTRPLKSVSPTEMVVWVSRRGLFSDKEVVVTVDVERRCLSIWRYVYIKPKDTPVPLGQESKGIKRRESVVGTGSRKSSAMLGEMRLPRSPKVRDRDHSPTPDSLGFPELPQFTAFPAMPPTLATTATMASLVGGGGSGALRGRRNSLNRNDFSVTMDRMVLGGRFDGDSGMTPIEHGRMKAAYWMERLYSQEINVSDARSWRHICVATFDDRWNGKNQRSLLAICLPNARSLLVFTLSFGEDNMLKATPLCDISAISATSLCITRSNVWDLLLVKPNHQLAILTHGTYELPLELRSLTTTDAPLDLSEPVTMPSIRNDRVVLVQATSGSSILATLEDGRKETAVISLVPHDELTNHCLHILALALPSDIFFGLHRSFLQEWSTRGLSRSNGVEFDCFVIALSSTLGIPLTDTPEVADPWAALGRSASHQRFSEDTVLARLKMPPRRPCSMGLRASVKVDAFLAPTLHALHSLAEDLRLVTCHHADLLRLVPIICRIALLVRPEWADYWNRLCPSAVEGWPSSDPRALEMQDDRIPVWPPDISAILYGRISNPDWQVPWHDIHHMATRFGIQPSFAFGRLDPLVSLQQLTGIYRCLADNTASDTQKRAENAVLLMTMNKFRPNYLDHLPIGLSAPIREAARTCQLAPPGDWPLTTYKAIGRNDLASSASDAPDVLFNDGYKPRKEFINPSRQRRTIGEIANAARASASGQLDAVSGVELDLADFTDIRFGQDRRLEEVARMLCSSKIPSIKCSERPDLSDHDQAKEYQNQVVRTAERTLALPYGRAMFTFGSIPVVTREAYAIPKLEFTIRIQPLNLTVSPEPAKLSSDSLNWGDFHNGVAAGLRISPFSGKVESSWIAFNKPSDLTPEHAGFLFGLGLTGHLKEMLTWHTFGYLTPKHDLTSIGVLLGLSVANIGSGNQHVTKLLAVHTPALLPTPAVDLNVSLLTQAAGLAGVGLLYMGTKNRRMAEVCLHQISRKDLIQPDLSNEHREAYTYSTGLAFGMVMLGKGSSVPADMALVSRLSTLIHGDADIMIGRQKHSTFDINLTSPASTIALGLMYLRTERQDIAEILTIPDTVLELNRLQPSFLMVRTIARALIMWDAIAPTGEWLLSQLPLSIHQAVEAHSKGKPLDDAIELAYYNILAGSCFVVGLKYAGTARQAAYMTIIRYFDMFRRLVYSAGPAFEHKIKRSAYRDGLNLISIALSMVMAGTGEITCFRRLRYAFGMYQQALALQPFKYGIHMATHMSIGLLFLGGGRFTLGTSDAAIACMVAAFFPRFNHTSADNKSYLQALRHLWVLAVEPRCLIARDVDTTEVVYLPVKITMKEGDEIGTTQLISPTLIPDLNKLLSIRVDTPRYWPFYLDTEHIHRHRESLLRSQTLFVKRRTAFLSYTEDPRGSRSLFVRSGTSAGDAATLDFPQLTGMKTHPASDISEFITSFSNDVLFLAFADHLCREGRTDAERLFHTYCHAALLDSILQDKPKTLQTHITLFLYRTMKPTSRYFHLRLQDLRFAADFYGKIYDRRFSGRAENNPRSPLIRGNTVAAALHVLDQQLETIRASRRFTTVLGQYVRGEVVDSDEHVTANLAWYLLRNGVPVSTLLVVLRGLARDAHVQCLGQPPPEGTSNSAGLDQGIKEVLHGTGTKMTTALGSGWSVRSLDEIIYAWNRSDQRG